MKKAFVISFLALSFSASAGLASAALGTMDLRNAQPEALAGYELLDWDRSSTEFYAGGKFATFDLEGGRCDGTFTLEKPVAAKASLKDKLVTFLGTGKWIEKKLARASVKVDGDAQDMIEIKMKFVSCADESELVGATEVIGLPDQAVIRQRFEDTNEDDQASDYMVGYIGYKFAKGLESSNREGFRLQRTK